MRRLFKGVAALALGMLVVMGAKPAAADQFQLTPAQKMLFDSDHMQGVAAHTRLRYDFAKTGSLEQGFKDEVDMTVTDSLPTGRKNLSIKFLSGKNKIDFPAMTNMRGNPLVMLFLERDVREMKRLTGGGELYFRNRIRYSFAEPDVKVKPVEFSFGGKTVKGQEVTVLPYVHAPLVERFPKFQNKSYTFIISDAVPGSVYKIESLAAGPDGKPLIDEVLTYAGSDTKS